jgi:hypothetical protein
VAERSFEVSTVVGAAPEDVVDLLVDLTRHQGLHPYLVSARVVSSGEEAGTAWRRWSVHERPRLGPVRYPIRFTATLTRTSPTTFTSDVDAAPGCTIHTVTEAEPHGQGARVRERATVRAPGPLVGYMARQAHTAHERTFRLLPDALSGRPPRDGRSWPPPAD